MKIVHIVPGAGDTFYCENCLRDNTLVGALRKLGHDVLMVPLYLPMFVDESAASADVPVFFGGINVYLQQKLALFRKTPRWIDKCIDAPWLLRWAASKAGSTRSRDLIETTQSMLRGEDGRQAKELSRLVEWLAAEGRPDVIHLSNALLLGLAHRMKAELGAPIVCSLQDEHSWVDAMGEAGAKSCWRLMAEKARDADALIAVSQFYGDLMTQRLDLPDGKLRVVHIGTSAEGHRPAPMTLDPPVIGFLSRQSPSLGLGDLVDAFMRLKKQARFKNLRLRATGGQVGDDHRFVAGLRARLRAAGMEGDVEFLDEFDRTSRLAFLQSLSVMCVPVKGGAAFGVFAIEAMASGVPVVEPREGAFPEMLEPGGAGVLYDPARPEALAEALESVLSDAGRAKELGRRGREAFLARFTLENMAAETVKVYNAVRVV